MTENTHTRIKKLSPLLINQLAAGEVVTRPAAVVKELLENAIDAGATHIEVRITQGGMGMIEVADNGAGIHPDDMVMAITRHATSKVADVASLQGVTTLGFRGEALAATAAVSRLTLTSSHDSSGVGRQLQVAGILADSPALTPIVHAQGTTVTVKDLYFNVPARRGNLKSIATEFGHIETIVRDVALACADINLELFHDNKKRLSLQANMLGSQDERLPLSRLEQALGRVLSKHVQALTTDLSGLTIAQTGQEHNAKVSGWIWTANESTLPKLIYINGRLVKEALISNELRKLASQFALDHLNYALYFELPTSWLNVNVHPSKQRIKISPLNNIMAHLTHSISSVLTTLQLDVKNHSVNNIPASTTNRADVSTTINKNPTQAANPRSLKLSDYQSNAKNNALNAASSIPAKNKHVAEAKQPYQTSHSAQSSISQNPNLTVPFQPSNQHSALLPQCLAVIESPPKNTTAPNHKQTLDDLPWLLFMSQGQLFLLTQQSWQSHMALLYDQIFAKTEFSSSSPVNARKINAAQVNQQIIDINELNLNEFIDTLNDFITNSAIAHVTTEQIVAHMLSSAT